MLDRTKYDEWINKMSTPEELPTALLALSEQLTQDIVAYNDLERKYSELQQNYSRVQDTNVQLALRMTKNVVNKDTEDDLSDYDKLVLKLKKEHE